MLFNITTPLPNHDFFVPREEFLNEMINIIRSKSDVLIEIGCGRGTFMEELRTRGFHKILGLELYQRGDDFLEQTSKGIMIGIDATTYEYPKDSAVIIARPNHYSDWVMRSFHRANFCGCKAFFYVGLERNLEIDIDNDAVETKLHLRNVGEDKENFYELTEKK